MRIINDEEMCVSGSGVDDKLATINMWIVAVHVLFGSIIINCNVNTLG